MQRKGSQDSLALHGCCRYQVQRWCTTDADFGKRGHRQAPAPVLGCHCSCRGPEGFTDSPTLTLHAAPALGTMLGAMHCPALAVGPVPARTASKPCSARHCHVPPAPCPLPPPPGVNKITNYEFIFHTHIHTHDVCRENLTRYYPRTLRAVALEEGHEAVQPLGRRLRLAVHVTVGVQGCGRRLVLDRQACCCCGCRCGCCC